MKNHFLTRYHLRPKDYAGASFGSSFASRCLLITFIPLIISSCATVDYLPPRQGTSAELQSVVARSLEETLKEIPLNPVGKKVDVHVEAVGGYETSLGLERYVKSLFQEWVVSRGGSIGKDEFRMDIFIPVLGATATSRELSYQYIPIYYSERFRTTRDVFLVMRNREGQVVYSWRGGQAGDWTDMYLMRMLGPTDHSPVDRVDTSGSDSDRDRPSAPFP